MTDETDFLRRLIEDEIDTRLRYWPHNQPIRPRELAREIAEEISRRLRDQKISIVRMHANRRGEDD